MRETKKTQVDPKSEMKVDKARVKKRRKRKKKLPKPTTRIMRNGFPGPPLLLPSPT